MTDVAALRLALSLLLVLAAILAGAWLVRRAGLMRTGPRRLLRVVETQNLGSRAYMALVEVGDTRLLLGVAAGRVSLLHRLPDRPLADAAPIEAAPASDAPGAAAAGFARILGRIMAARR